MEEDIKAVELKAKIEDAVLTASVKIDIIDALEEMAKASSNSIDDILVKLVRAAKDGMDWKGIAKQYL